MERPVHIQIYTMQTAEEALAVASLDVDHIGVTPADLGLPGEVALERAAEICDAVRGSATSVALTVPAIIADRPSRAAIPRRRHA